MSSSLPSRATIPAVHTCDGRDVSPPLTWSGAPAPAVITSFALIWPVAALIGTYGRR